MSIVKNVDGSVTICKPTYITKMMQIANITEGKNIRTPIVISYSEAKDQIREDITNYMLLVGLSTI